MKKKVAAAVVVLAVLIGLAAWHWWPRHHSHGPVAPHHATCWAQPGVIGYAGFGKYIPIYKTTATRHGAGPVGSDVCDKG